MQELVPRTPPQLRLYQLQLYQLQLAAKLYQLVSVLF